MLMSDFNRKQSHRQSGTATIIRQKSGNYEQTMSRDREYSRPMPHRPQSVRSEQIYSTLNVDEMDPDEDYNGPVYEKPVGHERGYNQNTIGKDSVYSANYEKPIGHPDWPTQQRQNQMTASMMSQSVHSQGGGDYQGVPGDYQYSSGTYQKPQYVPPHEQEGVYQAPSSVSSSDYNSSTYQTYHRPSLSNETTYQRPSPPSDDSNYQTYQRPSAS